MLREAVEREQIKNAANILKEQIQWYYIETTTTEDLYKTYDPMENYWIEKAFKEDKKQYKFSWVILKAMITMKTVSDSKDSYHFKN